MARYFPREIHAELSLKHLKNPQFTKNYVEAKMQKEATGFCHGVNNLKTNIHQYLPSDSLTKGKGQQDSCIIDMKDI